MTALPQGDRPTARPAPTALPQAPADAPHRTFWPALRRRLGTQCGARVAVNWSTEDGG